MTAIFFTSILNQIGLAQFRFPAILFAHSVLFLPYAIRILAVSFEQVRQDHIDAARDLGASTLARWRVAYWPALLDRNEVEPHLEVTVEEVGR